MFITNIVSNYLLLKNMEGDLNIMGNDGTVVSTWFTVYASGLFSGLIGLIHIVYRKPDEALAQNGTHVTG